MQHLHLPVVLPALGLLIGAVAPRAYALDPLVPRQWHLEARAEVNGGANVISAWTLSRGQGVVVGVVDDGVDRTHPDLVQNYSSALSWDFDAGDADPAASASESHGTAIAGLIAARGDNGIGVSGVAPRATFAGLRLNGDGVTPSDARDAQLFGWRLNEIHILNNSWAPGIFNRPGAYSPAGPGPTARAAIENAVTVGRGGLGRIFVWAAGNRGNEGKDCNLNGYANSRLGIAVGAYADFGQQSWFSEPCAALFIAAPSNGGTTGITTTDNVGAAGANPGDYRGDFGGTSSATAITSGVIALALARKPTLTWRDVQHILARTAVRVNPTEPGWSTNALKHNPRYGFGLIDAVAAVNLAATWTSVPAEQAIPEVRHVLDVTIPDGAGAVSDTITIPSTFAGFSVEHVEVVFGATHPVRGDLDVTLTSPAGVRSQLAKAWSLNAGPNYTGWRFGSVRHWGETAAGSWTLTVADRVAGNVGVLNGWTLRIYGTPTAPVAVGTTATGTTTTTDTTTASFTASVSYPGEGATVSGSVTVGLATTVPWGQAKTVTLSVDGQTILNGAITGTTVWLPWNTTTVANGLRTLTFSVTWNGQTATTVRHVNVANTSSTSTTSTTTTTTGTTTTGTTTASFTASVSYPGEGAAVGGSVGLGFATTAPWGQAKTLALAVDGQTVMTASLTGTTFWWTWNTRTVANGAHALRVTVTWNGQTASAVRNVTVANASSTTSTTTTTSTGTTSATPASFTAAVQYPAEGAVVRSSIGLGFSTTAPWGEAKTLALAVDGQTVMTASLTGTTLWWSWDTTTVPDGAHRLTVTVTWNGQSATGVRNVTVANGSAAGTTRSAMSTTPASFVASFAHRAPGATVHGAVPIGLSTAARRRQTRSVRQPSSSFTEPATAMAMSVSSNARRGRRRFTR